jgi:hypothetical protein
MTSLFTRAVEYARNVHVGTRKKTEAPYMAHLLGVVSHVMGEAGRVSDFSGANRRQPGVHAQITLFLWSRVFVNFLESREIAGA